MSIKKIAVYARVSTHEQSTELQTLEIRSYLKLRGWNEDFVFDDLGVSGTTSKRPQLQELLNAARRRRFNVLVIWKLDRLARSLKDLVGMLSEFNELGIELVSVKDNLDLGTNTGRLMANLLGVFAEFEAGLIKERVMSGLANARAKGQQLGRPSTVTPQIKDNVIRLRAGKQSIRSIAQELDISPGTVWRVLKS